MCLGPVVAADPEAERRSTLDPRRMLVLAHVARLGSLAAAAAELGWTQPAVAQHVRRLEREAGCPLVVRTSRGVTLTEAGAALAGHAEAVAARLRAAREDLDALADLRAGRVRLAAFPSACATVVPAALAALAATAPGLDVRLTEAEPPRARDLLAAGEADLAVAFGHDEVPDGPDGTTGLVRTALVDDPVLLVLPAGSPLARRRVRLADAAGLRWVAGCPRCRSHLVAVAGAAGFVPDIRHSTDDYVVTQTLVAAGLGVALLPSMALRASRHPGVVAVPVGLPPRRVHLDVPTDLPTGPARSAVVQALRDAAAAMNEPAPEPANATGVRDRSGAATGPHRSRGPAGPAGSGQASSRAIVSSETSKLA